MWRKVLTFDDFNTFGIKERVGFIVKYKAVE